MKDELTPAQQTLNSPRIGDSSNTFFTLDSKVPYSAEAAETEENKEFVTESLEEPNSSPKKSCCALM